MALVLCTGADEVVVQTRKLVLERAGHSVVTAMSEPAVISACQQHVFDVAVIGQTISPPEKKRILTLVRQHCPSAKVLELYTATKRLESADDWLAVPTQVPQELAERVAVLAGVRRPAERANESTDPEGGTGRRRA